MVNSSQVSYFTLGAYFDPGPFRYLYFFIIMSVYFLIVLSNLLLIVVICLNRTLHEPMYIFLCSLFVNELYGSTAVLPFVSHQILEDVHTVSYHLCLLQVFCLYSYGSVEFTNLAVISYDRYVAICSPLQYHTRMSFSRIAFLVALVWLPPFVAVSVTTLLTSSLQLCGNFIDKLYCDNYWVIKLSCFETTVNNLYELIAASVTVIIPLIVIFFTYIHIFKVCFSGSKQTRQKALSTCTPHLCSLINYTVGAVFKLIQSRSDYSQWPLMLKTALAFYHFLLQPLFNPLIYGLNLSKIRTVCKSLLLKIKNNRDGETKWNGK